MSDKAAQTVDSDNKHPKKVRVLVIDNSALFHEMLSSIFSNVEMSHVFVDSAAQGLNNLQSEQFDCICLSMYIEDSDGFTLTKAIRALEHYQHTPIFLLTSDESSDVYQKALSNGITEVFNRQNVIQLINFIQRFTLHHQPLSGHILYIEDTLSQQQMITRIFTERGLTVDAFSSAEEAWNSYLHHDYDLIVTDIILKGNMTGMALTNRIRRLGGEKGDVPILAITAFDDIARRIELFYLGISDYVIKPILEEELLARVRHLIDVKQLFAESQKQKNLAEEADIAKSEFIAHMNHELRAPMNAILGFSSLILSDDEHKLSTDQQENMDEIVLAGQHSLELINDITNISKIEAGIIEINIKEEFLNTIIETSVNRLLPFAKKHDIVIEPYSIPQEIQVKADPLRLHQVFINIISNAIKYNSVGGSVQILYKVLDSGFIQIGIKDHGEGLSDNEQKELFKPFSRLGQGTKIEGTGLGLVICRRCMELMNGKIDVKSKKGHGSTFCIEIPCADSKK